MFGELVALGLPTSARCGIGILDDFKQMELWTVTSDEADRKLFVGNLDMKIHPLLLGVENAWRTQSPSFAYELAGKDLTDYYEALNRAPDYGLHVDLDSLPKKSFHNSFTFAEGAIFCFTNQSLPSIMQRILQRFAAVFGQTYKRYLDLKKAEAQAREAEIQLALERVRARSMAMHKSDELNDVIGLIFQQFLQLGVGVDNVNFTLGSSKDWAEPRTFWVATTGRPDPIRVPLQYFDHRMLNRVVEARKNGESFLSDTFGFEEKNTYFKDCWFEQIPPSERVPELEQKALNAPGYARSVAFLKEIDLAMGRFKTQPFSEEENEILRRFATVFEQVYTRFLDLQKAEARAREARTCAADSSSAREVGCAWKTARLSETSAASGSAAMRNWRTVVAISGTGRCFFSKATKSVPTSDYCQPLRSRWCMNWRPFMGATT
jgi:hypothetical protein